jgi:hypothetical protein
MPALTIEQVIEIHILVDTERPETYIEAANLALSIYNPTERIHNVEAAISALTYLYHQLLNQNKWSHAAVLCWGTNIFDPRAFHVREVWRGLGNFNKIIFPGASSLGKTYNTNIRDLMDWSRDPWHTTIKYISTTMGHAKAQPMANIVRFHRDSIIPLPGRVSEGGGYLGMDRDDKRASISTVAIDKGSELEGKSGKLQGFHPYPRRKPHPIFGSLSRVRARLEECEDIPDPVWPGVENMLSTYGGGHVAVSAAYNPRKIQTMTARMAEPPKGWGHFDLDKMKEWDSKQGWHVIRLDGADCENVKERRIVYQGMLDIEGYSRDPDSADYYSLSRGAYPVQSVTFAIISPASLYQSRGIFIWERPPIYLAALDMAEEGGDEAIFTSARYGKAIAFQPEGKPLVNFKVNRYAVQIDQQFPLRKQNTILMGMDAMRLCRQLHVRPEWFALDCTSTVNLRDWLRLKWGNILGVKWGGAASDIPILEESSEKASDLYADCKTEMYFAVSSWAEFGFMGFSPHMDTSQLFTELTAINYRPVGKTMKQCELSSITRKQLGRSPDHASSCVMIVHLIRQHSAFEQSERPAVEQGLRQEKEAQLIEQGITGSFEQSEVTDVIEWI